MSREILFRGKRTDNCEWVYGNYCYAELIDKSGYEDLIIEQPADGETRRVIPETVGQYTGLTDKNGKKIFEGDIIKDHSFTIDDFSKVVYDTENAQFSLADCDEICDTMEEWERYREDYEIVGNVYDNPELVESED